MGDEIRRPGAQETNRQWAGGNRDAGLLEERGQVGCGNQLHQKGERSWWPPQLPAGGREKV